MGVRSIVHKVVMCLEIVNIFSHWVYAVDSSLVPAEFCRASTCLQSIQGVCQMLGHYLRQNKEKGTHKRMSGKKMFFEFN
jgi:hypothetical protein